MPKRRNVIDSYRGRVRPVSQTYTGPNGKRKYTYWQFDYVEAGTRRRRKFTSKKEAEDFADRFARRRAYSREVLDLAPDSLRDACSALGRLADEDRGGQLTLEKAVDVALVVSREEAQDARAALDLLAKSGKRETGLRTLADAVRFAVENLPKRHAEGDKMPLRAAVSEYQRLARDVDQLRPKSLESIRCRLSRFCDAFDGETVASAAREAEAWLNGLADARGKPLAPLTVRHYRSILHGFFAWCQREEWVKDNPASASASQRGRRTIIEQTAPGVLTPEQAARIVQTAEREAPGILPAVVLGLFCGLRRAEIERMRWEAISFEAGVLTVSEKVAKTRSIRTVNLQPAAVAWLLPHRKTAGPVVPEGTKFEDAFRMVRRHAGMFKSWPHNALRHSFASYHLAAFEDAAKTALQLGHNRGTDLLFAHYRGLVTPAQSAAFWAIRPAGPAKVVEIGAAAS